MEPSLAVLITGEVRTGQTLFDDVKRFPPSTQAILSVWDKVGLKLGGWIGPWQMARVLGDSIASSMPPVLTGFGELELFLPEFFETLRAEMRQRRVDRAALERLSRYVDVEDQRLFVEVLPEEDRLCNSRLIHYKLARALALMRIAEEERGARFDNVVRIRPDLACAPDWRPDFADDEIFLDWQQRDEVSGILAVGDNVILARREVMFDLAEFLRIEIYQERRGNIHHLLGDFVERNGLKVRQLDVQIADDHWPADFFLRCLSNRLADAPDDPVAQAFAGCVDAHARLERGDFAGAEAALDRVGPAGALPAVLCRGQVALAQGRLAEVDAAIAHLRVHDYPADVTDNAYYRRRLEWLLDDHLDMAPAEEPVNS